MGMKGLDEIFNNGCLERMAVLPLKNTG